MALVPMSCCGLLLHNDLLRKDLQAPRVICDFQCHCDISSAALYSADFLPLVTMRQDCCKLGMLTFPDHIYSMSLWRWPLKYSK